MNAFIKASAILFIIWLSQCRLCSAQKNGRRSYDKISYAVLLSGGRSVFNVHGSSYSPRYPTVELRAGGVLIKPLGNQLKLRAGVEVSFKRKRDSYFYGPGGIYTRQRNVNLMLDDASSKRHHVSVNIPLQFDYQLPYLNWSVGGGACARFWNFQKGYIDGLASRKEWGIRSAIYRKISPRLNAGADFYWGLSTIYFGSSRIKVTNQFMQLRVEYLFN